MVCEHFEFLGRSIKLNAYLSKPKTFTRNLLFALVLLSTITALPASILAQEQSFPTPSTTGSLGKRDDGALTEIRGHLQVVLANGWRDLKGTGTLTYPMGDAHTASLYLMDSKNSRLDIDLDSGTRSIRIIGSAGRFRDETGRQGFLSPTTSSTGIVAFPLIWTDALASPLLSIYDKEMYIGTGQALHRITIEHPVDNISGSLFDKNTSSTDLYFDSNTHLLLYSVDLVTFSGLRKPLTRVTSYSDYQSFDNVLVPTIIRQMLNGQEQWKLQLKQISINTNPPASTFAY